MSESTEMSLQQHALQEIDRLEAGFAELSTKYVGAVFDVTTTKGMDEAKAARQEIRQVRYNAENVRKEKASELRTIATSINDRAQALKDRVLQIEGPIQAQIEAEEERKATIKRAADEAAAAHRQKMQDRLAALQRVPAEMIGAGVNALDEATSALLADDLADVDDVYKPDAIVARDAAIESLAVMRAQRVEADEAAERAAQQEAENAKLRAQLEEQQRALAEQAAQIQRERDEREAADRAARDEREATERAERERQEAAEREQRRQQELAEQAERDRLAAEQAERDRAAREQAEAHARELAAERERAEAAEIANATLEQAARAGFDRLCELGDPNSKAARMLAAVLAV
jgi:hypothetical protein